MTKRILCIDGGGLRGVFAAAVIEQMEKATGRPAHDLFDCFFGTSAGSLLAAGMASGRTAGEMKQMFIKLGTAMGPLMSEEAAAGAGNGDGPSARDKASAALEALLKEEVFKPDLRPGDLERWLAMPARNMAMGRVIFFGNFPRDQIATTDFWDDRQVDENEPIWRAVRRSTALPPLFAPDGPYLDGGVSPFANPCYAAYIGVQHRLGWNPHHEPLRFFSVGTGYQVDRVGNVGDLNNEALYDAMVSAMMDDITFLQHKLMKRRAADGTVWYKRFNIAFDVDAFAEYGITTNEAELKELAKTATTKVKELADIGSIVGERLVNAKDFLDWHKDPTERRNGDRRTVPDRRLQESAAQRGAYEEMRSGVPRRKRTEDRRHSGDVRCYPSNPKEAAA